MLTLLLIGEIALLLALAVLGARLRRLRGDLDRLDARFLDFRYAAEEEIARLKAASADFRRRVASVAPELPFTPGTAVAEALEMHPGAAAVLASHGIQVAVGGGCGGDAPAQEKALTLEEAADRQGVEVMGLLARLNALRKRGGGMSLPIVS